MVFVDVFVVVVCFFLIGIISWLVEIETDICWTKAKIEMSDNKTQKSHTVAIIKVIIQTNKQKKNNEKRTKELKPVWKLSLCAIWAQF